MNRDVIGNIIASDCLVLWNGIVFTVVDIAGSKISVVSARDPQPAPIITLMTRMPAVGAKDGDHIFDMYALPSPNANAMIDRMLGGGPLVPPTTKKPQ